MRRRQASLWLGSTMASALVGAPVRAAVPKRAAALTLGLAAPLRSVDPHRPCNAAEAAVTAHVFETLVRFAPAPTPSLASSWTQLDDAIWIFNLRAGTRFADGTLLTADDVVHSLQRALQLRPELHLAGRSDWLAVDAVDGGRVRMRTAAAYATLVQTLAGIPIASAASVARADARGGSAAMLQGTGPYRISAMGDDVVSLSASAGYRGKRPRWPSVVVHGMASGGDRVEALRMGTLDAAERVPMDSVDALRADKRCAVAGMPNGRLMYLQLGFHPSSPPELSWADQSDSSVNPLLDRGVRRAFSEAIDRQALVTRVLRGLGEPAGQLVPRGGFGHVVGLGPDRRNLEDARSLLRDAGLVGGLTLRLHGPQGVYPADTQVVETLARMLRDVDVRAEVAIDPPAAFASRGARQEYSAYVRGFAPLTGDATEAFVSLLATPDARTGAGSINWARYSNGTLDSLIQRAVSQPRDDARAVLLEEATRLAMSDVALIPLYFAHDAWAMRAGLTLSPGTATQPIAERLGPRLRSA